MKCLHLFVIAVFSIAFNQVSAQTSPSGDQNSRTFTSVQSMPQYPGGVNKFYKHIENNLEYPEVARLLGISGKVILAFVVEPDGTISNVHPIRCIGAGCESEAVSVLESSGRWIPAVQDNKPVRVAFTVPINFGFRGDPQSIKVSLRDLKGSKFGFVIELKDKYYTLAEFKDAYGNSFQSSQVLEAEPYFDDKYKMPEKELVYLVRLKDQ